MSLKTINIGIKKNNKKMFMLHLTLIIRQN